MPTLRVIVERMLSPVPGLGARYAAELGRELVATAPAGCEVEAVTAAHPPEELDGLRTRLPGLARVHALPLGERELSRAWQYGAPLPRLGGMVHAPGLFAPLHRHDRADGDQITVTIHDAAAWTRPETLDKQVLAWRRAMGKRARKHADAVVVPTHAVAEELDAALGLGDRLRVISGAVGSGLVLPEEPERRVRELELPEEYLLAVGGELRAGLGALLEALALPGGPALPLLVAGSAPEEELEAEASRLGLAPGRVRLLGPLSDGDLALVLDRARVLVHPGLAEGFGLPVIEAFRFGTPVVHSDAPALLEVAGDAGVAVEREDVAGYARRLAEAIIGVLEDPRLADRLSVAGRDRERAFSWRDSAERIWQLHADL